ncbi:putative methionyl-tRNA synthetase [Hordeum vulgare]|nr:putative methionyl-tRNA synthetase [Hordeum vulgare]
MLQSVAPAIHTLTMSPWGYVPSPSYSDGDAYGGFNLNTTFPHGAPQRSFSTSFGYDSRTPAFAFSAGLNTQYSYSMSAYSSAASPVLSLH